MALGCLLLVALGMCGDAVTGTLTPVRRHDPVITRAEVVSLVEFEHAVGRAAAGSAVGPELGGSLLAAFKSSHRARVVSFAEWRLFVVEYLYGTGVAHGDASIFLELVDLGDRIGIDTGFLALVREVDMPPGAVSRSGNGVSTPRVLSNPSPGYPDSARGARVEGVVGLSIVILPDGSVANCRVKRSLGHGIDEAALLTVQNEWRFEPARRGGKPVPVEASVEIDFAVY